MPRARLKLSTRVPRSACLNIGETEGKLDRLRLRGPDGAKDEFHLAAVAQNLRKLAEIIPLPQPRQSSSGRGHPAQERERIPVQPISARNEFFNEIGPPADASLFEAEAAYRAAEEVLQTAAAQSRAAKNAIRTEIPFCPPTFMPTEDERAIMGGPATWRRDLRFGQVR